MCKPLVGISWKSGASTWTPYTMVLDSTKLIDDSVLRQTPAIFQELVPKDHELRVTIMGSQVFPAKVLSQETVAGRLDWRKAYSELKTEPTEIPQGLARACSDLMKRLGIVFGCFDFIVTPDGQYVFLEVNEMGQFLFVEMRTGLPLVDAFAEFLLSADPDFSYCCARRAVAYEAIEARVTATMREAQESHFPPLDHAIDEGSLGR